MKHFILLLISLVLMSFSTEAQTALKFDTPADGVNVNSFEIITGDLTYETWFRTSNSSAQHLMGRRIGASSTASSIGSFLRIRGNGQVKFTVSDGSTIREAFSTTVVNDGQWHHVAGVFHAGGNIEIYVDGVLEDTNTTGLSEINGSSLFFQIGRTGAFALFKGELDDVRVWNVARSSAEINANKDTCLDGDEAGLNMYFDFEEGMGTIAHDKTANMYDGNLLPGMDETMAWVTGIIGECNTLGVDEHKNDIDFVLFPNPSNGIFQIKTSVQDIKYRILSITGSTIQEWSSSKTVDLSAASSGIYFLESHNGTIIRLIKN